MKLFKRITAVILMIVMLTANVAYAATGKVTTINMTNLFDAYNSTKKTWNELKTAKHRLIGSFTAYCLQHKATVPNSESYNMTDMMDNYSAKVKTGLQIIVENGYPFNYGGLSAAQAEYATANAIRFWLSECGDSQFYNMTNLGSFSNSQLRTLAASGTITKKIAVRDASYIPALQFAVELLIKARTQKLMTHEIDLSADNITAERSDNVFTGRTMVSTVNLSGGYTLDQSGLPAGSSVTGYTGKSGDVLVVSIPVSESTANKTYKLVLTGKDDRVRNNMQVFCHNGNQAYQRVMCVRLGSSWYQECTTKTLTVTTGNYVVPMPDLTVTAMTAGSASYEAGSEMIFTATVVNQGTYDAVGSVISLSVNGTAVQREDLPELEVGECVDVEFTATAPATEQTLTVTAFADCYDIVDESNEDNNKLSTSVQITAPKVYPDLTISELTPSQTVYEIGESVSVTVKATNQGEETAEDFYVKLIAGAETWYSPIGELKPGVTRTLSFGFSLPDEPSTITITAIADSENTVEESNENNNTASTTVKVIEPLLPDLAVTSVYPGKESYNAGETVTVHAVIKNQGEQDADSFNVKFAPSGFSEQTKTVSALKIGKSITVQCTFTAPTLSETETRSVVVTADSGNVIGEADESNNTGSCSVTILGEKPDLTITSLQAGKAQYTPGETVTMTAVVKNNGIITCPASQIKLTGSEISAQTKNLSSLAPGASVSVSFSFTAPYVVGEKTFAVRATVDPSNLIEESNENNNALDGSFTVYNPQPDLTVTKIQPNKTEYNSGETGSVTVTVKNQGDCAVSNSKLKLTIGDFHSEIKTTSTINVGASVSVRFSFTAPVTAEQIAAVITATADPANEIPESNETNNTMYGTLSIKPMLPDVGITATNAVNWYAGMDVVVTATVANYTAEDYPEVRVRLTIGSDRYDEIIPLPGNGNNLAVFRVTLPTQTGAAQLAFKVDPDNQLAEENEGNNDFEKTIQIVEVPLGIVLDPDLDAMKTSYQQNGLLALPDTENSDYHIWQEVRLEDGAYLTKTFWAQMSTVFRASPDARIAYADNPTRMESGFGVNTNLTTQITTNYDHPEKLVGAQLAWVYSPESGYSQFPQCTGVFDSLENVGSTRGKLFGQWQQPVNPWSESGSSLHYTPLWYPDGQYTLLCQSSYAWSPAGQMYRFDVGSVDILGDMYDRVTAVQGR